MNTPNVSTPNSSFNLMFRKMTGQLKHVNEMVSASVKQDWAKPGGAGAEQGRAHDGRHAYIQHSPVSCQVPE